MSLVALDGTPLVAIGHPWVYGSTFGLSATLSVLQDAANEACIMHGYIITDDGASHTIDTSGSSSIGWLSGAVTFANASTRFKVGLAAIDTANGPAPRASNTTNVINFDVSKTYTSAAAPAANSWISSVPDAGTKTIANGDQVTLCTQMTVLGGTDAINTQVAQTVISIPKPGVTSYTGAAYAAQGAVSLAIITFSDGHIGWFYGGTAVSTSVTSQTWNSGSAIKEYGNYFQAPFPMKVYGLWAAASVGGDADMVLYSSPLGTPVAEKTVSVDFNTVSAAQSRYAAYMFASPYSAAASQPLAAIVKPTSATNVTLQYKTFNASAHQAVEPFGTNGYAVNRNTGAFAAQNSNKDRFAIGLLVGAFEHGVWPTGHLGV